MWKTFLKNVRIIDGTGAPAIENGLFAFENLDNKFNEDLVIYVGEMNEEVLNTATENDKILDLSGHTMLPGLFNVHTHLDLKLPYKGLGNDVDEYGPPYRTLLSYRRAAEALNCGITTIRNVGIADGVDIALKKAINKNMVCGPNMVTCGNPLIAHGGHCWEENMTITCSGPDAFAREARMQIAKGADQIKLMYTGGMASASEGLCDKQMTDEEVAAAVKVAHAAGKKVCAHLSNDKAIMESVRLGVDSVEHGYTLSEKTAEQMAKHGTYFVPTLCVSSGTDYLRALGCPEHQIRKGMEAAKTHRHAVRNAYKHGVKICIGTDMLPSDPIDGTNATVREMEFLAECGMSNLDIIKAATSTSAELCGLQHITGILKAGMMGDFIVVEGKPDQDISDLRNLRQVVKSCRLIWSSVPTLQLRRFSILAPGYDMAGGNFVNF